MPSSLVMNSRRNIWTLVSVGLVVTWKPGMPEFSSVFCWSIAFWSKVLEGRGYQSIEFLEKN